MDLSNLPVAPDDAFISGKTWNLLRRTGRQSTPPIPGTFEKPDSPRGIEMLMMIVDKGPNGEADPTDNTYWLKNVDITPAQGSGGSLVDPENTRIQVTGRDSGDESIIWKLGTNLAEDGTGTHSIAIGTPVRAKLVEDSSGYRRWEFSVSPPGGLTVQDCPGSGGPSTSLQFLRGTTVAFPGGGQATMEPYIIADPARAGIIVTYPGAGTCGPIKLGLDCSAVIQDVKYVAGVFYKTVCGIDYVVFSTTACPTAPGAPSAEFFAYNN